MAYSAITAATPITAANEHGDLELAQDMARLSSEALDRPDRKFPD